MNLKQIAIRLPTADLERATKLISVLAGARAFATMGRMTRAKVLRLAVSRGLDVLEGEFGSEESSRVVRTTAPWRAEED